jgi:hypothetical protein
MSTEMLTLPATEGTPSFSRERSSSLARRIAAIGSSSTRASRTPVASAFNAVTFELFKLGAIPLERFETEDYPEETVVPDKPIAAAIERTGGDGTSSVKTNFQAVAKIYEACMRTFGNSDPIKWEFMMELGPNCEFFLNRPAMRQNIFCSRILFRLLGIEREVLVRIVGSLQRAIGVIVVKAVFPKKIIGWFVSVSERLAEVVITEIRTSDESGCEVGSHYSTLAATE